MKKSDKKAQQILGMSFEVIFSILLIIFFVIVAFIAIKYFMNTASCTKIGLFVSDFKNEIDNTWNSQSNSYTKDFILPTGIEYVCFIDYKKSLIGEYESIGNELGVYEGSGANMYIYPAKKACKIPYHKIAHLNMDKIVAKQNPYCIENNGKISIRIKKEFNDKYVSISKE